MAKINYVIVICVFESVACFGSVQNFLNSLKDQKVSSQTNQQLSQGQQQQNEENELNFLKNFYGNPKYQAALTILNNEELQTQYEQALNDYQLNLFEYTSQVLGGYHVSGEPKAKTGAAQAEVSLNSFLNSIQNKKVVPSAKNNSSGASSDSSNQNSVASYLNSLKG